MHKKRLDSWKAIAEFLGRSLRTVQRWHDLNGLPVHHFGGQKGSVFAYEEEIDAWLSRLSQGHLADRARRDEKLEEASSTSHELVSSADGMWEMRSIQNIHTISDLYHSAIDTDPTNAAAFIGLANAMVFSAMNNMVDVAIALPMAQDALKRIPPFESDSVDAKCPTAWINLLYHRNWRQARANFEEVVKNRPSNSFARSGLALSRLADGDANAAVENGWEAWRLNPLVRSLSGLLCWFVYLTGDFKKVLDLAAQMNSGQGTGPVIGMVEAMVLALNSSSGNNVARLEDAAQRNAHTHIVQGILGYAYANSGQTEKAHRVLADLTRGSGDDSKGKAYPTALVFLGLNEIQDAISLLERAFSEGSVWSLGYRCDPMLRKLRGQPRFERLLGKIGAPMLYQHGIEIQSRASALMLDRAAINGD